MNREALNLAPTPIDEPCAQVGSDNYQKQSTIELRVFKKQLYRMLEEQFKTIEVSIVTVSHSHDFGSYRDVEVKYEPDNEESCNQAFWLEENLPENWDEEALTELKELGYQFDGA